MPLYKNTNSQTCAYCARPKTKQSMAGKKALKPILLLLLITLILLAVSGCSILKEDTASKNGPFGGILGDRSDSIDILLLLTVLTLLPSILIMLTGFTRIIIVLSLTRNGLGLQQMPPNQVLIGLALFLTLFVMSPIISDIKENAYTPYVNERITEDQAVERALKPLREFMFKQTYKSDLRFFMSTAGIEQAVDDLESVPTKALIPAFMTSEIKRGFEMGFYIYIPFIVVDMVVASTLMAMGMMMLPPVVISLPFKLLLFVVVDGWTLTVKSLLGSFY